MIHLFVPNYSKVKFKPGVVVAKAWLRAYSPAKMA